MPGLIRILVAALALSPLLGLAAEPILIYERVHRQVAAGDNAVRLVVFDDDRVEARFPFYSPDAGAFSWRITPGERTALLDLASPLLDIQADRLLTAIDAQRTQGLSVVTDADRVTLEVRDAARGSQRIVAPSPEIWARNLPDGHEMGTVADIARQLAEWMRDEARERQP